jgi:hypothetical protein
MPSLPQTFYVYVLARPNGKPFYVGKGTGRRIFKHDYEARNGCACHKCNIIRKIWRSGGDVQRYIMLETDNEQESFDYEIELIALYGLSTLANRTAGGDGPSNPKEATRAKMRAAKQGRPLPLTQRERIGQSHRGRKQTPEWIAKRAAAKRGIPQTEESRARMSASHRARVTEADREATRQAQRARWADPEMRAKYIASAKVRSATPEGHARLVAVNKGRVATPETRAKLRDAQQVRRERERQAKEKS